MTRSKTKTNSKQKKVPTIPKVPFTFDEVYLLTSHQGSKELWSRLKAWRNSNDYQFIKSLDGLAVKSPSRKSKQQQELEHAYIQWLIGLESDKFKALSEIHLSTVNLDSDPYRGLVRPKVDDEEKLGLLQDQKKYRDVLNHTGIL